MGLLNWSFFYGVLTGSSLYGILKWLHNKFHAKKDFGDDCLLFLPRIDAYKCITYYTTSYCKIFTCPVCNLRRFLSLVKSTKQSLDICVYLITSDEITAAIMYLFKKGVFVRVIVDKQTSLQAHNSKMNFFIKEHIPIKVIDTTGMMHNKFVIIDDKTLITGSFNWTMQGIMHNYENAVIIQNPRIIRNYQAYFHNIWHEH